MPDPIRRSLLLLPVLCWSGPSRAEDLLPAVMARLAAVPARRAAFREVKRFGALSQALESTGHLAYRRPDYLEKVTDWPQPERLVVDGDRLILTDGNAAPRVVPLSAQPELRTLVDALRGPLAGDLAGLRRAFTLRMDGTPEAWTMDMAPIDPAAAKLLRSIQITGAADAITGIVLRQANGDEQAMQIGPSS